MFGGRSRKRTYSRRRRCSRRCSRRGGRRSHVTRSGKFKLGGSSIFSMWCSTTLVSRCALV